MKDQQILNPFVVNDPLEIVALPKKQALQSSSDISDDATLLDKLEQTHYLHDRASKVSVYQYPKTVMYEILYGRLTPKGRDLLLYIMYSLPEEQDYIKLKPSDITKQTGISRASIFAGLKTLVGIGLITLKSQSVYWVNPKYIFNGNRIKYYKKINTQALLVKSIVSPKQV